MLRRASLDVDDANLPRRGIRVGRQCLLQRVGRGFTTREHVEQLVAVFGARVGLCCDGANTFANPWNTIADARHARCYSGANFAGA